MSMHGSGRGWGRLWLVLLVALGTALIPLMALLQQDSFARADEQRGRGHQITLERGTNQASTARAERGHKPERNRTQDRRRYRRFPTASIPSWRS